MPTVLTEPPISPPPPVAPPRKKWTRAECQLLESSGMLEGQHLELVDGELINKMGKNRPHVSSTMLLLFWLAEAFGKERVNSEAPIDVSPEDNPTNEPEPDIVVFKRPHVLVRTTPQPSDLHLVVEVSDTSLQFDLTSKAALYARAEIVEYWVLDINGRRMIVHRDPQGGIYRSVIAYNEDEKVSPLGAPHAELRVSDAIA